MVKSNHTVTYTKAVIDKEAGTITEYLKDCTNVYFIDNILDEWDGVEGISITIKKDKELPSEEYADEL